jgi:cysteine-rich repeat protein
MKGKSIVAIAALAAGTFGFTSAHASATIPQKCASAKQKASGKKEAAKLNCHAKATGKAIQVDPACLLKAEASFMSAFTKADAKGVCEGTESTVEFTIDHCVDELIAVITPGFCGVTTSQACTDSSACPSGETCVLASGKCPAAKLKASGKDGTAKAACWAKATGKGLPTGGSNPDPTFTACLGKADAKLMAAFTKADGSAPCAGSEAQTAAIIDNNCVQPVMGQLPPVAPGCGNGFVDPGESCDDGNTVDGDGCPSTCVIQDCTVDTGTHQGISLQLTAPAGVTVGALTLLLDYPEGKVRMPVTMPPSGVTDGPVNDLNYAMKDPLIDATFNDGIPANGAGPMLQVMLDGCQGQPLPAAATEYTCTILDASDEIGTSIDVSTLGCMITIP